MADPTPPNDEFHFLDEETSAIRLDALGDFLIEQAGKIGGVAALSTSVQREAIDLARQILEKLKLRLGEVNILDGLHFTQDDDVATMGSMEDVLNTYNQLLASAAAMDPDILMHPAVMSATQAFGQMGFLSKEEALRLATSRRNTKMAERIAAQISRIQNHFAGLQDTRFAALAERIQRGFSTVLGRMQNIAGPSALVGHSVEQNISSFMTGTPTAGQATRQSLTNAKTQEQTQKNIQMQQAEDAATRAQAQRLMQQSAPHQAATKDEKKESQQTATTRGRTGRQQLQQARATTTRQPQQNTPAPAAAPKTQAPAATQPPGAAQPPKPAAPSPADIVKQIDPRILMGFQTATSTSGIKTATVGPRTAKDTIQSTLQSKPATAPPPPITPPPLMPGTSARGSMATPVRGDAEKAAEQKKKKIDEQMLQPPPPPPSRGGGRGV